MSTLARKAAIATLASLFLAACNRAEPPPTTEAPPQPQPESLQQSGNWDDVVGEPLQVEELVCSNGAHCHLGVAVADQISTPERTVTVTRNEGGDLVFVIVSADGGDSLTCAPATSQTSNTLEAACTASPHDPSEQSHSLLATVVRKVADDASSAIIEFKFTHPDANEPNILHNGTGHTHPKKP